MMMWVMNEMSQVTLGILREIDYDFYCVLNSGHGDVIEKLQDVKNPYVTDCHLDYDRIILNRGCISDFIIALHEKKFSVHMSKKDNDIIMKVWRGNNEDTCEEDCIRRVKNIKVKGDVPDLITW
jgi:hypothetical protein